MNHDTIDRARVDIEKYIKDNNITAIEWDYIERYIDEQFNFEKDKVILKPISN
ncbi:MAG: hypothetical protein IKF38_05025 [Clostridia bacterium]|nr:hypothetical protein [Clostridia bacterium]